MTNSTLLPVNPNGEYVYHAAGMLPGWRIISCSHSSKDPITLDNIDEVMEGLSTRAGGTLAVTSITLLETPDGVFPISSTGKYEYHLSYMGPGLLVGSIGYSREIPLRPDDFESIMDVISDHAGKRVALSSVSILAVPGVKK